jgi:hypothetical protein
MRCFENKPAAIDDMRSWKKSFQASSLETSISKYTGTAVKIDE